ncbi:MAG: TPM domain-containing protein [Lachnospiraceae bacterium]|nr:TPM domain-containing protein [Lachnospiraceae bacterium]
MIRCKKLLAVLLSCIVMASMAIPALAADGVTSQAPAADLREAADALDISSNADLVTDELGELHAAGVHLFDAGALMNTQEKDQLEVILAEVSKATGFDVNVVTSNGLGGCSDAEELADLLYYKGGLGTGSEKDGTLLLISIARENDVYIYTHGMAIRYVTDRGMDYIYDDLEGGMISALQQGQYAKAAAIYAQGVLTLYNEGIQQDQHNVDPQGNTDYYYPQEEPKKSISIFEVLIAGIVSAVSGILPVNGVKKKYAMEAEKRLAQGFNQAYKATAAYVITQGDKGQLLTRYTKTIPIPRPQSTGGGRPGGISGHGGGSSHVSSGMGGSMHGGSGRKF